MEAKIYKIWNDTQTRRLPSGQRFVEAWVGRKWVWVKLRFEHQQNRKKIHRSTWERIVREAKS